MQTVSTRDRLQQGIYLVINPFVKGLIKIGLTPNAITTIGLLLNIGVAVIFVSGAERTNRGDLDFVGWAGALVLFAGLFDMLDGQVARLGNMSSKFGALYDSVLDRYSELILFLGICYYLVSHHYFLSSLFAFIAMIGSMMVSYTRARAEGLGIECKGGLMQRPERVITIGICAILCGVLGSVIGGDYKVYIPGLPVQIFETMSVFTIPITIMAFMTNITAVNRLRDAKKALDLQEKKQSQPPLGKVVVISMIMFAGLFAGSVAAQTAANSNPSPIKFPTPKGIENELFYLQRDPNTNTVIYQLNLKEDGKVDPEKPVNVYWMRYADKGQKEDLSYVQRKFAYGLQTKALGNDEYELRFVSHKKLPLYLKRSAVDKKYHVYIDANDKKIMLDRVFVRIEGGSYWIPNVRYVELKGLNVKTQTPIVERLKI
jgi:phosphatidylglycerophosphate synthase